MLLLCLFILFIRKVYKIFMKCDRDISWINVAECYVVTITILAKNDKCFFDEFLNVNTSYNIFGYVLNLFNIFSSLKIAHVCFSFTFCKWVSLWTLTVGKKRRLFRCWKEKLELLKCSQRIFRFKYPLKLWKFTESSRKCIEIFSKFCFVNT